MDQSFGLCVCDWLRKELGCFFQAQEVAVSKSLLAPFWRFRVIVATEQKHPEHDSILVSVLRNEVNGAKQVNHGTFSASRGRRRLVMKLD